MNSRQLLAALAALAAALPFAAGAQIYNPDNDSRAFFAYKPSSAQVAGERRLLATGEVSVDGRYVWKNPERGWVNIGHSYVYTANGFQHAANCLAYDAPKAPAQFVAPPGAGT